MTFAPPFFLVAVAVAAGFLAVALVPAIVLSWAAKRYQSVRVRRPFFTIYLVAGLAFIVQSIFALPQAAVSSVIRDTTAFVPPYLVCFLIVGFIVFGIRTEGDRYGKSEALSAGAISLACVSWFYFVEQALRHYAEA